MPMCEGPRHRGEKGRCSGEELPKKAAKTGKAAGIAIRASSVRQRGAWAALVGEGWGGEAPVHHGPPTPDSLIHVLLHPTSSMISITEHRVTQPCAQGPFGGPRWTENRQPLRR